MSGWTCPGCGRMIPMGDLAHKDLDHGGYPPQRVLLRDTPEDVERLWSIIKDYSGLEDDQVADTTDYIIERLRGGEGA